MKVSYFMITLVYSRPKYVQVIVNCACSCGTVITTNAKECPTYGRVIVKCKRCKDEAILPLDRETIKLFHSLKFPNLSGIDHFLDSWEKDMVK